MAPTQVRVRCVAVVVRSACIAAGGRVTAATSAETRPDTARHGGWGGDMCRVVECREPHWGAVYVQTVDTAEF